MEILPRYWSCVWFSLAPRTFAMDNVGLEQTYQVKSTELRLTVNYSAASVGLSGRSDFLEMGIEATTERSLLSPV